MPKKPLLILCACSLLLGLVVTANADVVATTTVTVTPLGYSMSRSGWNVYSNLVDTLSYDVGVVTTSTGNTYNSHAGGSRTGGLGGDRSPIPFIYRVDGGDMKELFTLDTRKGNQSQSIMNATSLAESEFGGGHHANNMDARKQDLLQTLFNHTYSSIFDESGNYVNVNMRALQMAIWEIMYEVESSTYVKFGETEPTTFTPGLSLISDAVMQKIGDGGVWVASEGAKFEINIDEGRPRDDYDLANFWLGALTSDDPDAWTSDIYGDYFEETHWDLTVYTTSSGTRYGNLIGVGRIIEESPPATPEPASFLILGLAGAVGLPVARRLRRKTA